MRMNELTLSVRRRFRRAGLGTVLVAVALLAGGRDARAGSSLRRPGAVTSTTDAAAAAASAAAAQAVAAAQGAQIPLRNALDAIRARQAAQDAARAAAQATPGQVPNGLQPGGLEVASGITQPQNISACDASMLWCGASLPSLPEAQSSQNGRTQVTITQAAQKAILTWKTFNLGSQTDLYFNQSAGADKASDWVALNRVVDPNARPSQIMGSIKAEGQVYIVNQNGIIFGATSQVNVSSLIASSLEIAPRDSTPNQRFLNGLFDQDGLAFVGPAPNAGGVPITVEVDAGAQIAAASYGHVLLLGSRVLNSGKIEAPDGQVLLAAGGTVYLESDTTLARGFKAFVNEGGQAVNSENGFISTPRGNITIVGSDVEQNGLATATISADESGSIRLGSIVDYQKTFGAAIEPITVQFGKGSISLILPEVGGKKVVGTGESFLGAGGPLVTSGVEADGDRIDVLADATLYAPGSNITLAAQMRTPDGKPWDPKTGWTPQSWNDQSRVYIESGARLDVSGLQDVDVAMEQNVIQAELRADDLRDNPTMRDGPLRGQTVYFDARLGQKLVDGTGVANLSGYYDLLEWDVSQLMTKGGTVNLTGNQIIQRKGSTIDLSGGSLHYLPGYVKRTVLIDEAGNRVPIEDAVPGVRYVGMDGDVVVSHQRWGVQEIYSASGRAGGQYQQGYVQGDSAGTLAIGTNPPPFYSQYVTDTLNAPGRKPENFSATGAYRVFDGDVVANIVHGPAQRELPGSHGSVVDAFPQTWGWKEQPAGATLNIAQSGDVVVASTYSALLPDDFDRNSQIDVSQQYRETLPTRWLDGSTFGSVSITSGSDIDDSSRTSLPYMQGNTDRAPGGLLTVKTGASMDLGDGGSFSFSGKGAEIDGTLLAPGGKVSLTALSPGGAAETSTTVHVGTGGVIDVAGRLSNDLLDGTSGPLRALNGGKVTLKGTRVVLEPGSRVDVSGGGRISAAGGFSAGKGGAITVDVSGYLTIPELTAARSFLLGGTLSGYAVGQGGSLEIDTLESVSIGNEQGAGANLGDRWFAPQFFEHGGFSSYTIKGSSLRVASGTEIDPSVETLALPGSVEALSSGTRLDDVAPRRLLPEDLSVPMTLTLTAGVLSPPYDTITPMSRDGDALHLEGNSSIKMVPGSTVNLYSDVGVSLEGKIEALGGGIHLTTTAAAGAAKVDIAAGAELNAAGYQKVTQVGNLLIRSVAAGGTITIDTGGASLNVAAGATIDVSGWKGGSADLPSGAGHLGGQLHYQTQAVDGDAGNISITAPSGVAAGQLKLAPGGPSGRGGTLVVDTSPGQGNIVVSHDAPNGSGLSNAFLIGEEVINGSGADDVTLKVADSASDSEAVTSITFHGDVDLRPRRSLTLISPQMGSDGPSSVKLQSDYVALEGTYSTNPSPAANSSLESTLDIEAGLIDVSRTVLLGCASGPCANFGFGKATLTAAGGDIRLTPGSSGRSGLFSPGVISFEAAQVYVTSRNHADQSDLDRSADDPGFLVYSNSGITIARKGDSAPVPLSYGERLTLEAPIIDQGGVVRAPQGQLILKSTDSENGQVILEKGSITSTSLEGATVPFGSVELGGVFVGYDQPGQAPTKSLDLSAPHVAVNGGALIDMSGGGDLQGYLFSTGNGGSSDILSRPNTYAILPTLGAGPAPKGGVDALRDATLQVGDSVWLQGVPGLAAGYYSLLPAHYALLPGGLLIQPLGVSYASPQAASTRGDGAVVVSGYLGVSGTTIRDPGYRQFVVMSQDVLEKYSRITTYSFNDYADQRASDTGVAARTPNDAGTAVIEATKTLTLQGTGSLSGGTAVGQDGKVKQGLAADLDITAQNILVVGADVPIDSKLTDQGYLVLDVGSLVAFGAGSVALGGTRATTDKGTELTVRAQNVDVNTGAKSPWTGLEIILAAKQSVTVEDGSIIRAIVPQGGTASTDTNELLVKDDQPNPGAQGEGALVRLSTGARVPMERLDSDGNPIVAPQGRGLLSLVGSAQLSATGSLTLEANQAALSPQAQLSAAQLDIASAQVNLGDVPQGTGGLTIGPGLVGQLASSTTDLLIRGYGSIDLWGNLDLELGGASQKKLTFDTPLIQGHAGDQKIAVGQLTFQNSGAASASTDRSGTATLTLDAGTLALGPGNVQLLGYSSMKGRAGAIAVQGSGMLDFSGDIGGQDQAFATSQIRGTSGAAYRIKADGGAFFGADANAGSQPAVTSLGGQITLEASSIFLDSSVVLPSGTFAATATSGNVSIGQHASIDVGGKSVDFHGTPRFAPGGIVQITASGDLAMAAGATISVSGASEGGDAGEIDLKAGGAASVAGTLSGSASAGYNGGAFSLGAQTLTDFSALVATLDAGMFTRSQRIWVHGPGADLALTAGKTITAHEVLLRSDSGAVTVAGTIDAAGRLESPDGGDIQLVAGGDLSLSGSAALDASAYSNTLPANAYDPAPGKVELTTNGGTLDVAQGASINVAGRRRDGNPSGGVIVIRAPQIGAGVAIKELAGNFVGAEELIIQGTRLYDHQSTIDAPLAAQMVADAMSWLGNAGAVQAQFPGFQVAAGMTVQGDGDLTVAADVDLHSLDTLGGPGYLGINAKGNIAVNAAVSDGFAGARSSVLATDAQGNGVSSASIRFEAGGDVSVGTGGMIRTGTGDISIQAGGSLSLASPSSVIYTAGKKTGWAVLDGNRQFDGAPSAMALGEFPTEGGDIDIRTTGDIVAPLTSESTSAWLFRYGDTAWNIALGQSPVKQQASWSVVYGNFEQGVAALGGGNVRVRAGGNVENLQVSIPTTGQLTTSVGNVPQASDLVVRGGGNLDLLATGDIQGGLFMLGLGEARLRAGGDVEPSSSPASLRIAEDSGILAPRKVGMLLGLMNARATVTGGGSVYVEGAFDPMSQGQVSENLTSAGNGSAFSGYIDPRWGSPNVDPASLRFAALDVTSIGGEVTYESDPWASADLSQAGRFPLSTTYVSNNSLSGTFGEAPPTLRLASLQSDVILEAPPTFGSFNLQIASAPLGTLELLAGGNVQLKIARTTMGELSSSYSRGPLAPFTTSGDQMDLGDTGSVIATNSQQGFEPIHLDDPDPVRIYATDGSICAGANGSCTDLTHPAVLTIPKPMDVRAGLDIAGGEYYPQNNGSGDLTIFMAGRDIQDPQLQLRGTGDALLQAGRDVTLAPTTTGAGGAIASGSVVSTGNRSIFVTDPALPANQGTNIYILAGASNKVDYDGFAKAYLDPNNAQRVVKTYLRPDPGAQPDPEHPVPSLLDFMSGIDPKYKAMGDLELIAAFDALPLEKRELFLDRVYFQELEQAGIEHNDASSLRYKSYSRGSDAIKRLFPDAPLQAGSRPLGSVALGGNPLQTNANASIEVLAPYGMVQVGSDLQSDSNTGGIVTHRGGNISIMADQDIALGTSRVFTMQGGDILMWTSNGGISAGMGSKTSVIDRPLVYTMDKEGVITIDPFGLQTGAGIGVLDALQGTQQRARSRIDLIAPEGEIDFGDAGVRAINADLNVAAVKVANGDNIQVTGGKATGVPQVEVPPLGALTAATAVTQAVTKESAGAAGGGAAATRNPIADLPSVITVEVVGYEDSAQQPAGDTPEERKKRETRKGK